MTPSRACDSAPMGEPPRVRIDGWHCRKVVSPIELVTYH